MQPFLCQVHSGGTVSFPPLNQPADSTVAKTPVRNKTTAIRRWEIGGGNSNILVCSPEKLGK